MCLCVCVDFVLCLCFSWLKVVDKRWAFFWGVQAGKTLMTHCCPVEECEPDRDHTYTNKGLGWVLDWWVVLFSWIFSVGFCVWHTLCCCCCWVVFFWVRKRFEWSKEEESVGFESPCACMSLSFVLSRPSFFLVLVAVDCEVFGY